ncbi:MAG: glycyl-radical enzyme activating protein [Thermodesulfobacteriota bacterium]|nr:glycyl-radical enzyme activating protein [Thermodesulfobacteriota bacterium]
MRQAINKNKEILTATVLNIQRMSTEDGPGIRTTVFFKGCSLACTWCHNPESISMKPQIQWIETKCIGCKTCVDICPESALTFTPEGIKINKDLCNGCGICSEECPSTAMEMLGKKWNIDDLLDEVEKDRAYFENSGGGITVSGGEPAMQAPFIAAFLEGCSKRGLHTTMDTCGMCTTKVLDMILPHTDMVLYDLKEIDPERHKRFTGHSNEKILDNAIYIREYIKTHKRPYTLWIRTPIIPDATATSKNIRGIGDFIAKNLNHIVSRWELCSFNNLCRDKYLRLGIDWSFKDYELLTKEFMEHLTEAAKDSGVDPKIVHWTGATRVEKEVSTTPDDGGHKLHLVKSCNIA